MPIKNIFLLQTLKIIELIIPIIAIPIVIDKLGLENFGITVFIQSFMAYFVLIGEWGFNTNAVREYSTIKIKPIKWFILFLDIQKNKIIFSLITGVLFFIYCYLNKISLLLCFIIIMWGCLTILHCRWFFQAREVLNKLVYISLPSKILYLILIVFSLSKESSIEDYIFYLALPNIIIFFYSNLYFLFIIKKNLNKRYKLKKIISIKKNSHRFNLIFKEGWHLISSRLVSGLQNPLLLLIAKQSFSLEFLGFFGVCQRIISAAVLLLMPIIDVFFPILSKKYSGSFNDIKYLTIKILIYIALITIIGLITFNLISQEIFLIFNLEYTTERKEIILVYILSIFFSVSNSLAVVLLVISKKTKFIFPITLLGIFLSFLYLFLSLKVIHTEMNIVLSILIGQAIILLMMFFLITRKN